jgi:hypothetical protein
MGSKQRQVIIMFPRHTLETSNFRDPTERHQDDRYRELYTTGVRLPRPHVFARAQLLPLLNKGNVPSAVDEDQIHRLYTAGVSLMPEKRGLTGDQMLSVTTKITEHLLKDYDPSVVDN